MNQLISQRPNVQPRRLSFCAAVWITLVATCLTSNATHASGDKDSAEVAVKSVLQTVEHLRAAAERGEAGSMNQLGIAYAHGRGVQQDRKQAVEWYLKAAEKGNVTAMLNLGWAQLRGHGVAKDNKKALEWARKAAIVTWEKMRNVGGEGLQRIKNTWKMRGGELTV